MRVTAAAAALALMTICGPSVADETVRSSHAATAQPAAASVERAPSVMSTAMRSSDLDRSIKFYTHGLGMTVLAKRDAGAVTEVIFSFEGQMGRPGLMVFQDKGGLKSTPVEHGNGGVKVILDVPDVEAVAAKLTAAGYPAGEIHQAGPYRILNAQDPDGYKYEIVQRPLSMQPRS